MNSHEQVLYLLRTRSKAKAIEHVKSMIESCFKSESTGEANYWREVNCLLILANEQ